MLASPLDISFPFRYKHNTFIKTFALVTHIAISGSLTFCRAHKPNLTS